MIYFKKKFIRLLLKRYIFIIRLRTNPNYDFHTFSYKHNNFNFEIYFNISFIISYDSYTFI